MGVVEFTVTGVVHKGRHARKLTAAVVRQIGDRRLKYLDVAWFTQTQEAAGSGRFKPWREVWMAR